MKNDAENPRQLMTFFSIRWQNARDSRYTPDQMARMFERLTRPAVAAGLSLSR